MSYVLFGITSTGSGQRGDWGLGAAAGLAAGSGTEAAAAAATAGPGRAGMHDPAGIADDGGVLSATPTWRSTLDVADADGLASGYDGGHLRIGLTEANWNWITKVELLLTGADLAAGRFGAVTIFNLVDVRLKLGDALPPADPLPGLFEVDAVNARRGEFDFAAPSGVHLDLSVWSNTTAAQNSFAIAGSGFDDIVVVTRGALPVESELAAPLPGLVEGGQHLYMGGQTGTAAALGAGDVLSGRGAPVTFERNVFRWGRGDGEGVLLPGVASAIPLPDICTTILF